LAGLDKCQTTNYDTGIKNPVAGGQQGQSSVEHPVTQF
jgi:hypothetical protein